MRIGKRMTRTLSLLERKLRGLGRGFTLHDIQEFYGCEKSTAYKVLNYWERTGVIQPVELVRVGDSRRIAYEFVTRETSGNPS